MAYVVRITGVSGYSTFLGKRSEVPMKRAARFGTVPEATQAVQAYRAKRPASDYFEWDVVDELAPESHPATGHD